MQNDKPTPQTARQAEPTGTGTFPRPEGSLLFLLALPVCLIVYSRFAVSAGNSLAGLCDAATFVVLVALALLIASSLKQAWLRWPAIYLMTTFFIVFFVGNAMYFRFFEDWVHYQILNEWRVGPSVAGGALRSLTVWDWLLGVGAPLLLAFSVGRRRYTIRLRPTAIAVVALLGATIAGHRTLCARSFSPDDHNVFNHFARGWIERYTVLYFEGSRIERIAAHLWDYYPSPETGYTTAADPEFPLVKVPTDPTDPEPLGAIDQKRPPNVVLVLMESVRAAESGAYGAEPSFTPELDRLAAEGLRFHNFYANGSQTVRGEMALLCSFYPNLSGGPIYTNWPSVRMSSLPAILKTRGYKTLWISSFPSRYANKEGFLSTHGIDEFHEGTPLHGTAPQLGWGPTDDAMFEYAAEILDRQQQPFFAEITTLLNHWPFDWPYPTSAETPKVSSDAEYTGYTRGIYYTDRALGKFVERMRSRPYFDNTIFIFTGDHGAWYFPPEKNLKTFQKTEAYFRSPMVFYAPALIEPLVSHAVGSQVDFAPTMLHLLGIRQRNAFVGRSLLEEGGPRRYALMAHTHRWNLRVGNRYVYDTGLEFFKEHFPIPPKGYQFDQSDHHVLLESDADLLEIDDPKQVRYGPESQRIEWIQWAEDLLLMNRYLLEWDRIYDRSGE